MRLRPPGPMTAGWIVRIGAVGRTRTGMGYPIRPSNVRVYQFHHDGTGGRFYGLTGLPVEGAGAEVAGAALPVAGAGAAGAGAAGAGAFCAAALPGSVWITEDRGRASRIERSIEISTKPTKAPVVSLWRNVVAPRAPKAVWLPPPPKAPAMSAPLPCWSRTTRIRKKQITT